MLRLRWMRWRQPRHKLDNTMGLPEDYPSMPKISVEVPEELLTDLDRHVGDDAKFVNRSEAVRASIRKTLDVLDEVDERHGRLEDGREQGQR